MPPASWPTMNDSTAETSEVSRVSTSPSRRCATFSRRFDRCQLIAPLAVTRAAVLYVFRCLVQDDIPLNDGCLEPLRLIVPWKYGFKGVKSIVKIRFVEEMPRNTWQVQTPSEYGFYANVNPDVDHPRWSQKTERRIGELFRRKTLMFNGYADQVATLYEGMDLRKHY